MNPVRDATGRSPLYRYDGPSGPVFATSIRELWRQGVPRKLSRAGLRSYLEYGCVYEPLTLVEGVTAVWPELVPAGRPVSGDPAGLVRAAVEDAVRRALPVRPAAFLSGGIDSSAVVAVMRRLTKEPIDTFCVVHEDPKSDEREWARLVARANGTRHHEMPLTAARVKAEIVRALDDYDQPSMDGINSWFAAKMVRELGFDTVLSGTGGDELFAGYDRFAKQRLAARAGGFLRRLPRTLGRLVECCGPNERTRKFGMLMGAKGDPYFQVRRQFSDTQVERLCPALRGAPAERPWEDLACAAAPADDLVNRISWLELRTSVLSMYARDGWDMARAHGLEVRSPLLDPELVRLVFRIPGFRKLGDVSKPLLVQAAGGGLPPACVTRPKMGFGLPFDLYFREALKDEMEAFAAGELWDGLDARAVRDLWRRYEDGRVWWTRVWGLFVLSHWIRRNGVSW